MNNRRKQTIYHVNVKNPPTINMKVEKNSRGYNFEVSIQGAETIEQALQIIEDAEKQLNEKYGTKE